MMRADQSLGEELDATEPAPNYTWYNAEWQQLLKIDWTRDAISGGTEVRFVHQPTFEQSLHDEVRRRGRIDLHLETECIDFVQADDHVTVRVRDSRTGAERSYTARFLIGIDGANSMVREKLGIGRTDLGFEADWLVVDFALKQGLTYRDLGIVECGQWCNPQRPTTIVPGGSRKDTVYRRWEFMRLPHETREEMADEAKVRELLGDWIKPEQGDLVRHAVYTFRSLVADRWREGRVLLAGDAAHLMPPFMGQVMCAGLRDVWNLGWKLDRVLAGTADESLLDSYQPERLPHVTKVIKASMFLGSIICISDPQQAAERDALFLSGEAPAMEPFPVFTDGFLARDASGALVKPAGELSPHGTVRFRRRTGRFDSLLPGGFRLVANAGFDVAALAPESRAILQALGVTIVEIRTKTEAQDDQVADTQNQFLPFMASHGINAMLVRPDFYLFGGAAGTAEMDAVIADLGRQARQLGLIDRVNAREPATA